MKEDIKFDYRKLRGRIVEVDGNITSFCKRTGMNRSSVCHKLVDGRSMRQDEILNYADALGIGDYEYKTYFFTVLS